MAKIRTIKPDFYTSEQVAECSIRARYLFIGLWVFSDDSGIHPASPRRLKMEIFPADDITADDIDIAVTELIAAGLLTPYEVDGTKYLQVNGFDEHQKITRPYYKHPLPDGTIPESWRDQQRKKYHDQQSSTAQALPEHCSNTTQAGDDHCPNDNGNGNGNGNGKNLKPQVPRPVDNSVDNSPSVDNSVDNFSGDENDQDPRLNAAAWEAWVTHREEADGKPLAVATKAKQRDWLITETGGNHEKQAEIIEYTIRQGYKGLACPRSHSRRRDQGWMASREGVEKKAAEIGLQARRGETHEQLKSRILQVMDHGRA